MPSFAQDCREMKLRERNESQRCIVPSSCAPAVRSKCLASSSSLPCCIRWCLKWHPSLMHWPGGMPCAWYRWASRGVRTIALPTQTIARFAWQRPLSLARVSNELRSPPCNWRGQHRSNIVPPAVQMSRGPLLHNERLRRRWAESHTTRSSNDGCCWGSSQSSTACQRAGARARRFCCIRFT